MPSGAPAIWHKRRSIEGGSAKPVQDQGVSFVVMQSDDGDTETTTGFVKWECATTRKGWRVKMDASGRLVFVIDVFHDAEDFSSARVIVNNLQMYMRKLRRERVPLPPWVRQIAVQQEAQLYAGPCAKARGAAEPCNLCSAATDHGHNVHLCPLSLNHPNETSLFSFKARLAL